MTTIRKINFELKIREIKILKKLKVYLSFLKIKFLNEIQYKMAAFAGTITQFAWGAMNIMLYSTFLTNGTSQDYTISQMSTYIWLQQAFLMMFNLWRVDAEIVESCKNGGIALELVKPVDLYSIWHAKTLGKKLAMTLLRAVPILIICSMPFLGQYRIVIANNLLTLIPFTIVFILSVLLLMAYLMLMNCSIIKTISAQGVRLTFQLIMEFCSGSVIPIAFMPDSIIKILKFTPFYYMQNVSYNIFNGHISNFEEIVQIILLQIIWIIILTYIARTMMKKELSKIVVQGG